MEIQLYIKVASTMYKIKGDPLDISKNLAPADFYSYEAIYPHGHFRCVFMFIPGLALLFSFGG
jgi:hypothetical protein